MFTSRLSAIFLAALLSGTCLGCVQQRPPSHLSYSESWYWESTSEPIPVFIDTRINLEAILEIERSIEHWNNLIGWRVFEYSATLFPFDTVGAVEPPEGTVYVYMTELGMLSATERYLGITTRFTNPPSSFRIRSCTVRFDEDLQPEEWFKVSLHEFGHVLGLSHDEDITSIMFHYALMSPGTVEARDISYIQEYLEFD